jgi:Glycosyl transferases group 1
MNVILVRIPVSRNRSLVRAVNRAVVASRNRANSSKSPDAKAANRISVKYFRLREVPIPRLSRGIFTAHQRPRVISIRPIPGTPCFRQTSDSFIKKCPATSGAWCRCTAKFCRVLPGARQPQLKLGGFNTVEFIGEINERSKAQFLGEAQALLFPIDWPEPFGLVMIEAMACGTPVLAFRQGAVSEIRPGDHGRHR